MTANEALRRVAVPERWAYGGGHGRRKDCVHGAHERRGVARVDQPVRAVGDGVGEREAGAVHELQEVEVAERLGEQEARRGRACGRGAARLLPPGLVQLAEPRPRARMHGPRERDMRGDAAQRAQERLEPPARRRRCWGGAG